MTDLFIIFLDSERHRFDGSEAKYLESIINFTALILMICFVNAVSDFASLLITRKLVNYSAYKNLNKAIIFIFDIGVSFFLLPIVIALLTFIMWISAIVFLVLSDVVFSVSGGFIGSELGSGPINRILSRLET